MGSLASRSALIQPDTETVHAIRDASPVHLHLNGSLSRRKALCQPSKQGACPYLNTYVFLGDVTEYRISCNSWNSRPPISAPVIVGSPQRCGEDGRNPSTRPANRPAHHFATLSTRHTSYWVLGTRPVITPCGSQNRSGRKEAVSSIAKLPETRMSSLLWRRGGSSACLDVSVHVKRPARAGMPGPAFPPGRSDPLGVREYVQGAAPGPPTPPKV